MSYAAQVMRKTLRRLVTIQLFLVLACAGIFLGVKGGFEAISAVYGGGIALLSTLISAWRLLRATEAASRDARSGMAELYIGAAVRFVLVLGLMAVGMAVLKLNPLAVILGFAAAQVGYTFNRVPTDAR